MDFVSKYPDYKDVLTEFDVNNKTNLAKIIAEGPEEQLKETKFTQPAILFHSIVALKTFLKHNNVIPDFVAGHSLGEFSALVANGVLSLKDAMYLVHRRGEFMIKANDGKPFAMAAIIGLDGKTVRDICTEVSKTDIVIAANFNTPVQTVISGSKVGVEKACEMFKEIGAKRIVPLIVGGPFHSPLISKAGTWLKEEMQKIVFHNTKIPVVSNVNAKPTSNPQQIIHNLAEQVTSSVLWVDSVIFMIEEGVNTFYEFGPKKVLAGMIKKINREVKVFSIDTIEDLEKI